MDNNTGNGIISLLYTSSYSYPGFFTSMQRFLYSVFVRPRIFFYRIHMTAAKKKKHYSERERETFRRTLPMTIHRIHSGGPSYVLD